MHIVFWCCCLLTRSTSLSWSKKKIICITKCLKEGHFCDCHSVSGTVVKSVKQSFVKSCFKAEVSEMGSWTFPGYNKSISTQPPTPSYTRTHTPYPNGPQPRLWTVSKCRHGDWQIPFLFLFLFYIARTIFLRHSYMDTGWGTEQVLLMSKITQAEGSGQFDTRALSNKNRHIQTNKARWTIKRLPIHIHQG